MKAVSLKLILRSWWRNKTFTIISILSLAVGIACTNLLAAFVIHEYNVEKDNPNRDRIALALQDNPMKEGVRIPYLDRSIPSRIKDTYPEVEDYMRMISLTVNQTDEEGSDYGSMTILTVDPSFTRFFPYEVVTGSLEAALTQPDMIAISEEKAAILFGKENPIGKTISNLTGAPLGQLNPKEKTFQVAAVFKAREQAFLLFDALIAFPDDFNGGSVLFLFNKEIDWEAFPQRLKEDDIQTLIPDRGQYYFVPLAEAVFSDFSTDALPFMHHQQYQLLQIGVFSALLILLIACFNYVNLSFSRIIQQLRMIHTQKLMGAESREIRAQLFIDTLLTVIISFLLSLLLMHDLLPIFNSIVAGRITGTFFYSWQLFPLLLLFVLILATIPSLYMSRKLIGISSSDYRQFFVGKRQFIVGALVVIQFIFSISLITAFIIVRKQVLLTQKSAKQYENLVMFKEQGHSSMVLLKENLPVISGVVSASTSDTSLHDFMMRMYPVEQEDGTKVFNSIMMLSGDENFASALQLKVIEGVPWKEAREKYGNPVYLNKTYFETMIPPGEYPVGNPISKYDKSANNMSNVELVIAGIVDDFHVSSLEQKINPGQITLRDNPNARFLFVRLDGSNNKKAIEQIQQVWDKINPNGKLEYEYVYTSFMEKSKKVTDTSNILTMFSLISILLTCFGLFGMTLYATGQRTKEIAVRKVNGASIARIMLLLNQRFIFWIGIAFAVAIPIVWAILNHWLEQFAYRISINFWVYILAVLIVLCVTLVTVSWHSYQVASGNPVKALRSE